MHLCVVQCDLKKAMTKTELFAAGIGRGAQNGAGGPAARGRGRGRGMCER